MANQLHIVTGSFGYTGKYITRRLLSAGEKVKTLTGNTDRLNEFGTQVQVEPFNFQNPKKLIETLKGATTLFNTYWVRFDYRNASFAKAVENTKTLIHAAIEAGIKRIVHISITNATKDSPLPYFQGKGILEEVIRHSALSYAIIRPTVIFGKEDILINNIAWFLRRFPIFAIPGSGDYQLQPIFVEDIADIAVASAKKTENIILDAVGPEIYKFREIVSLIAEKIKRNVKIVKVNSKAALFLSKVMGYFLKDVVITSDELEGLMNNLLVSSQQPTGKKRFGEWLNENSDILGVQYASELKRHYVRPIKSV